jgi:hypothetical protein
VLKTRQLGANDTLDLVLKTRQLGANETLAPSEKPRLAAFYLHKLRPVLTGILL